MKRILWATAAASVLVLGLTAAQTSPARADLASGLTNLAAADQATDLSSAKKKKKKAMKSRKGGGASKAGTGGGAAGESGAGATSDTQQGKPRGNPAAR